MKKRKPEKDREALLLTLAGDRAFTEAIYSHLVDLAYERLKDPEYRAFLDEFLTRTYKFLSRPNKKNNHRKPKH